MNSDKTLLAGVIGAVFGMLIASLLVFKTVVSIIIVYWPLVETKVGLCFTSVIITGIATLLWVIACFTLSYWLDRRNDVR